MTHSPKTILITGASSGIGAALAVAYAHDNVQLVLIGRNAERLAEVMASCRARGAKVLTATMDVRDKEVLAEFLMTTDAITPIDLVIANAGISAGFSNTVEEHCARAQEVFDVNLQGVLNTIHPLIPRMVARRRGHLVLMSSLAGIRALPSAPAYSASKAAVRVYGDALRGELAPHQVAVSVVCPGWIDTPLTRKNDFPMPFILSPERAVQRMKRGIMTKKARIAFPRRLYYPLRILDALPLIWSDRLFARMPKKRLKS